MGGLSCGPRAGDDFIWNGDFHFGDWLAFASTRSDYPGATTGKDLIATAFFAHSTDLLAAHGARARQDGRRGAVRGAARRRIKAAFAREFVTRDRPRRARTRRRPTRWRCSSTCCRRPLRAAAAGAAGARRCATRKHLTTGFVGTPYLCHVLSRYGYLDEAYLLLNREEYPSWLYPVTQGATTIWERWDGQKPDGSFQDTGMNSFNHYAYGAIGDWMYRVMAGIEIDPAAPGYKHILIQPQPGGGFTSASAVPRDALRPRGLGVDARRTGVRAGGRGSAEHDGDGPAAEGAARGGDGVGQGAGGRERDHRHAGRTETSWSSRSAPASTGSPTPGGNEPGTKAPRWRVGRA